MTQYNDKETSAADGEPFKLIQFIRGDERFFYTCEEKDRQTEPGYYDREYYYTTDPLYYLRTWTKSANVVDGFTDTGKIERSDLDMTLPVTDSFALGMLSPIAPARTNVTIYRGHHGDTTGELIVQYKGRVVHATIKKAVVMIKVESLLTSLKRNGIRRRQQKTCNHALYGRGCNLVLADHQVDATASAVSRFNVTVSAAAGQADGYYAGGVMEFAGVLGYIIGHTGTTLTLSTPIVGLSEYISGTGPAPVKIAPGCPRTLAVCTSRFNNFLNYGGFPYIPDINPFGSQSIGA